MKILTIGDLHFKNNNLDILNKVFDEIIRIYRELKPNLLVFLGDIFDSHELVHVGPLSAAQRCFSNIINNFPDCRIVLIVGNHDISSSSLFLPSDHLLTPFKHWPNIEVVDSPKIICDNQDYRIIACPYTPPGKFVDAIKIIGNFSNNDIIFAHQEFLGAKTGAYASQHGDIWDNKPLIISGHIHERQKIGNNILYIGTPFQQNFAESENKGISLLEFDNLYWKETFITIDTPIKKVVDLTVQDAKNFIIPDNCILKINIIGTQTEILSFKKTEKFRELNQVAKIYTKITDVIKLSKPKKKRESFLDIINRLCYSEDTIVKQELGKVLSNEAES